MTFVEIAEWIRRNRTFESKYLPATCTAANASVEECVEPITPDMLRRMCCEQRWTGFIDGMIEFANVLDLERKEFIGTSVGEFGKYATVAPPADRVAHHLNSKPKVTRDEID